MSKTQPFEVVGMLVTELLRKPYDDKPQVYNLVWVRYPLEEEVIDGKENNFFHACYGKTLLMDQETARKGIRERFLAYWKKIDLWVP